MFCWWTAIRQPHGVTVTVAFYVTRVAAAEAVLADSMEIVPGETANYSKRY